MNRYDPEMWAVLEDVFGDYDGPFVNVEQTVIDGDVERWRSEEAQWTAHLQRHGDRPLDRRVAEYKIREAREQIERVRTTAPDVIRVTNMETREGLPFHGSAEDWKSPLAKYTLIVFRNPETCQTSAPSSPTVTG